jgi:DNA modification methylase
VTESEKQKKKINNITLFNFYDDFNGKTDFKKESILNQEVFLEVLSKIEKLNENNKIKFEIKKIIDIIKSSEKDKSGFLNIISDGGTSNVITNKEIILEYLNQIIKAQTIERAKYYITRLKKSLTETKESKINDLNLNRWKEYNDIITDSLWIFSNRDTSGAHLGWYWGNFIPQIPHQIILRYTKKGDWILDTFVGSGTTLIECRRLGRNGIGIELNSEVARKAEELVSKEQNKYNIITEVVVADSRTVNIKKVLEKYEIDKVQLIIMHPPYHDIIRFSNDKRDLSNAKNTEEFLKMFGEVLDNVTEYLENGRYLALVIGDKYSKGEWIPLGFYCMNEVLKRDYLLKSIVVKNFEDTRGKRNQKELWRYRALVGGFYVFKHEYIFLFKKVKK